MRTTVTIDGNEAAAYVAYKTNEVIAIYPITPSSTMGELADAWAAAGQTNLWGGHPIVQEMQSEGGVAGAVHGALLSGALTTTFTASQGLLLMIPDMFKIAGELVPTVFHIAARTVATHALSIFGDHSDVMAVRSSGWAQLFANSVQEVMDFALIAQVSTLRSRVPFLHVFDGFRTSHEVTRIETLPDSVIGEMIPDDLIRAHRARGLSPDHPVVRGTAQNPDVFFQCRERGNSFYLEAPKIVQDVMDAFAARTGRQYHLFDYVGAPDAERAIVIMGSGAETVHETVQWMEARGERVGVLKVRLYRPFSAEHLLAALPQSVRILAVLDRTKEPGAAGEPLFEDVVTAIHEHRPQTLVIGGRYGLSSKEFTPAMVRAVFDEMRADEPKPRFTVGIVDDLTHLSLPWDADFDIEPAGVVRAVFWGVGSDGTVGANKNSIKIIGEETDDFAQGYFVYDSKKSGSVTVSHLRFGPHPIRSPYLIRRAGFVAVHHFGLLERAPVLDIAADGATVLLNSPHAADQVWTFLPRRVQRQLVTRNLKLFVLDATAIARDAGLDGRTNTVMQTAFFALSGVLPMEKAIVCIKHAIEKTYRKRGENVVRQNYAAVDSALDRMRQVVIPALNDDAEEDEQPLAHNVTMELIAGHGDALPVSAMPVDGAYPCGTSKLEKRDIALEVPLWDPSICIQCGKCVLVCPHAAIRACLAEPQALQGAPQGIEWSDARWKERREDKYVLAVSTQDCTGCSLCVETCPVTSRTDEKHKALNMIAKGADRAADADRWSYFLELQYKPHRDGLRYNSVKNVQLLQPLFEYSGACAGCGETPYLKLISQLFGQRAIVANATGCSSIYGGNLPTTPWTSDKSGRGPAWANSLFEDNAEFGAGIRIALDQQERFARSLVEQLKDRLGASLADAILQAPQVSETEIEEQRARIAELKSRLEGADDRAARDLLSLADVLVKRSVWIVGGDGWAYDIGYGGLDHVLSSGLNVNIFVLDTEVYSNTGGQMSKATARGAVAKFAAGGRRSAEKDLGRLAMTYGDVFVAQIAMGADDAQSVKAILQAEAWPGPSLVIAYCHCIAHGFDMRFGMRHQKLAVDSGHWLLYRYDPALRVQGKNPLQIDCKAPTLPISDYMYTEARFRSLVQSDPEAAERLLAQARDDVAAKWQAYQQMASASV